MAINNIKEAMNLDDFSKLKDSLIREKALSESQQEKRNSAVDKLETVLKSVDEKIIEELKNYGLNIDLVLNPDYVKLKSDKEYLEEYQKQLIQVITKVRESLKGLLTTN